MQSAIDGDVRCDDVEVHDLSDTLVTYTLQGPQVGATVEALGGAVPEEGVHATISWNSPNPREGAAKVAVLMCRSERSALGGVDLVQIEAVQRLEG